MKTPEEQFKSQIAHLKGREQALETFDCTPGRVDRLGLPPRQHLHPGGVDELPGLSPREGWPRRPRSRGSPLPMICAPPVPWVRTAYARENDMGWRCAPRRSGRAHRRGGGSSCTQRSCESLCRAAGTAGNARVGLGATRQSEGLLRVRGRARLRTPGPAPSGRSQTSNPSRKGVGRRFEGSGGPVL